MAVASGIFNTPDLRTCSNTFAFCRFGQDANVRVVTIFFGPSIPNCWDMKSLGYGEFFRLWSYLSTLFSMIHMKNIISLFYGNSWIAIHQQHSCGISLTDIGYPWRSIGFVGWVWYLYLPLVYSPLFPWSKKNVCLCFFFPKVGCHLYSRLAACLKDHRSLGWSIFGKSLSYWSVLRRVAGWVAGGCWMGCWGLLGWWHYECDDWDHLGSFCV